MEPFAAALKERRRSLHGLFHQRIVDSVFIPILLMGGIIGRLFREFAMTLARPSSSRWSFPSPQTPCMCAHVLKTTRKAKNIIGLPHQRTFLRWHGVNLSSISHRCWIIPD